MLDRYQRWVIARILKKFVAIFILSPVFLIFCPFAAIGNAVYRAINQLYYSR